MGDGSRGGREGRGEGKLGVKVMRAVDCGFCGGFFLGAGIGNWR